MERNSGVTAATDVVELGKGPARDAIIADKYRVETTLGFGGMGVVIAARHLQLDERVAIKVLRDDVTLDSEHVQRFIREAQAAVRLKSEHVARIQDVGTLPDGKPYMVMELLEGLDLGRVLQDQGQLAPAVAVDMVLQACDALAEAHSIGIVHRDIKPTNLFVTHRRDGSPLLKVLDFGISKAASAAELSLTQTSSVLGTPAYMSPEQMRSARNADARSDIWSLGTVLYELVEGNTPFSATNFAELCVAVATEDPRPMTRAPELQPVLEIALAKSPDARFPSIAELALALEPFASDLQRARRQVGRIFRVLGKQAPPGRDATPTTPHRDSSRSLPQRDSSRSLPERDSSSQLPRPTTFNDETSTVARTVDLAPPRRTRRAWLYAIPVVLLAAAAAGAVILFTGDEPSEQPSTVKMSATPPALDATPTTATAAGSATGSAASSGSDLDSTTLAAGSDTGSGASGGAATAASSNAPGSNASSAAPTKDATIHRAPPPPHHTTRPPPRHATRPPPPHTGTTAGSAAPASTPPSPPPHATPVCDPFANPKGCGPRKTG